MNRINAARLLPRVALLLPLLLAGCVSFHDSRFPPSEGWRYGWVQAVGSATEMSGVAIKQCLSSGEREDRRYVRVSFRNGRISRTIAVPVTSGVALRKGDTVYVNTSSCVVTPASS